MSQTQEPKEEEEEFLPEEIHEIAFAVVDKIIGNNSYVEGKVPMWTSSILERLLSDLAKLKRPFKYIVNCCVQQRTGAGLHLSCANYWDSGIDGACTVKWNNDFVYCCVHVIGVHV